MLWLKVQGISVAHFSKTLSSLRHVFVRCAFHSFLPRRFISYFLSVTTFSVIFIFGADQNVTCSLLDHMSSPYARGRACVSACQREVLFQHSASTPLNVGSDVGLVHVSSSCIPRCYVLNGSIQNKCVEMVNVHGFVDESRHTYWATVNTELLLQAVHSVNQISVCAAVTDWCYQFGLTEGKRTSRQSRGKRTSRYSFGQSEEVDMLVSLRNLAFGNKMQGGASFRVLEKRIQMTQLCEKTSFQHLVIAENCYTIRHDLCILFHKEKMEYHSLPTSHKEDFWQ